MALLSVRWGALALLSALVGCIDDEAEREAAMVAAATVVRTAADGSIRVSEDDRRALGLETTEVVEDELPDARLRFGLVHARLGDEAVLVAPIAGRVRHLPGAAAGASIEAGAAVLTIEPVLQTVERVAIGVQGADLQGQIAALRRDLEFREAEAARARELAGPKIISAAKLQEAETAVETARARLAALQQARGVQVRRQASEVEVAAPLAGVLTTIEVPVGAVVRPGDVLARVLANGPRWVEVAVEPSEPSGDGFQVEAGGRWVPAQRVMIGALAGADGLRRDRLEVEAADLVCGSTVPVRVVHGPPRGLVLPSSAIVATPRGAVVYVEREAGTFTQRHVSVVAEVDQRARVTGEVQAGERVAIRGVMGLHGETLRDALRQTE